MLVSYTHSYVKVSQFQITMPVIASDFSHQQTPLHVAASNGHDYTVECLVKKGAVMNIKDKKGVSEKLYL